MLLPRVRAWAKDLLVRYGPNPPPSYEPWCRYLVNPTKGVHDLNSVMDEGVYRGCTIREVINREPEHVAWMATRQGVMFSDRAYKYLNAVVANRERNWW